MGGFPRSPDQVRIAHGFIVTDRMTIVSLLIAMRFAELGWGSDRSEETDRQRQSGPVAELEDGSHAHPLPWLEVPQHRACQPAYAMSAALG